MVNLWRRALPGDPPSARTIKAKRQTVNASLEANNRFAAEPAVVKLCEHLALGVQLNRGTDARSIMRPRACAQVTVN